MVPWPNYSLNALIPPTSTGLRLNVMHPHSKLTVSVTHPLPRPPNPSSSSCIIDRPSPGTSDLLL